MKKLLFAYFVICYVFMFGFTLQRNRYDTRMEKTLVRTSVDILGAPLTAPFYVGAAVAKIYFE